MFDKNPVRPLISLRGWLLALLTIPTIALMTGCAGSAALAPGGTRLRESHGSPAMREKTESDVYVGASHDCADEATARSEAELEARKLIVQSMEIDVSVETAERILVNGEKAKVITGQVFQDTKTQAVARNVLRVRPLEFYVERWEKNQGAGVQYFYKAWCSMRYTREQHDQMVREVVDAFLSEAEPCLRDAESFCRAGRIRNAVRLLRQIEGLSRELERYHGSSPAVMVKARDVMLRAESLLASIRIAVRITESVEGTPSREGIVQGQLVAALSASSQFAIKPLALPESTGEGTNLSGNRDAQAVLCSMDSVDLLLLGDAEVSEVSHPAEGIYMARATMHFQLVEGASGTVLWETLIPGPLARDSRGFAGKPDLAARRALSLEQEAEGDKSAYRKISGKILSALE